MRGAIIGVAILGGVGAALNGASMLAVPADWYSAIPGVTATGAFNQHFIRDIGLTYLLVGAALLIGALSRDQRLTLWTAAGVWLSGHALFHVWEVASGICGPGALVRDFPAVALPAILTVGLAVWAYADRRNRS